ncbi:MAG TPA: hypothetical protein DD714_00230 [Candidatus Omnitrophica bacterium]|nr:hypothetical protein [Candidatus Omnitrophota bacterium]HBQ37436.1 hypothetical protein [Candidatus Omnitrophota bacterium]
MKDVVLHCLCCGGGLKPQRDASRALRLTCARCAAAFTPTFNRKRCLIAVELLDCGTPECCQRRQTSDRRLQTSAQQGTKGRT